VGPEPIPPIDLLPLRLRGSRLLNSEEYRLLKNLSDSGSLTCLPKPRLIGKFFVIALSTAREEDFTRRESPLGDDWFIYSRLIFPRTAQFYLHLAGKYESIKPRTRSSTWTVAPELGFSTPALDNALLTRAEARVLEALLNNPLASGRDVASSLDMSYGYVRHIISSLRKKKLSDYVFCGLNRAEGLGSFVQLIALLDEEKYIQAFRELGLSRRNSRMVTVARFALADSVWILAYLLVSSHVADELAGRLMKHSHLYFSSDYVMRLKEYLKTLPQSHWRLTL